MKRYIKPVSVVVNMASEPVMQVNSMPIDSTTLINTVDIKSKRRIDEWEEDFEEDYQ